MNAINDPVEQLGRRHVEPNKDEEKKEKALKGAGVGGGGGVGVGGSGIGDDKKEGVSEDACPKEEGERATTEGRSDDLGENAMDISNELLRAQSNKEEEQKVAEKICPISAKIALDEFKKKHGLDSKPNEDEPLKKKGKFQLKFV